MNIETLQRKLVLAIGIIAILSGAAVYLAAAGETTTALAGPEPIMDSRQMPNRHPTAPSPTQSADVVMEWNQEAITRILAAGLPAPRQLRAMSIVQVSVHDAVNGLTREFETYLPAGPVPENASIRAAAIAAAYTALRSVLPTQSPAQQQALTQTYLDALSARGIATDDPGVVYGRDAALNVLAFRANDGNAQANCTYTDRVADPGGLGTRLQSRTPGISSRSPSVLGKRKAVGSSKQFAISARTAPGTGQRALRARLQ